MEILGLSCNTFELILCWIAFLKLLIAWLYLPCWALTHKPLKMLTFKNDPACTNRSTLSVFVLVQQVEVLFAVGLVEVLL